MTHPITDVHHRTDAPERFGADMEHSTTSQLTAAPTARAAIRHLPHYSQSAVAGRVRWRASSNESPVAPSPGVVAAVTEAAAQSNRYPTVSGDLLATDIAARLGLSPAQVVTGGGSNPILQYTLLSYTNPGQEVVLAWRSYEAYPILIGVAGGEPVHVPLDDTQGHDLDAMLAAITPNTAAIIVCNPNNPTGTEVTPERLTAFLDSVPRHVLVVLDEAYREFGDSGVDGVPLLAQYPNLVVLRTFSKAYGLAGARAGYMLASEDIANTVRAASPPFGLSRISEAAARAAWADEAHLDAIVDTVRTGRSRLSSALRDRGHRVPVSGANFVWVESGDATLALEQACADEGVSIRAFPGEGLRVTVGEREAEDAVVRAFETHAADAPAE